MKQKIVKTSRNESYTSNSLSEEVINGLILDCLGAITNTESGQKAIESYMHTVAGVPASYANVGQHIASKVVSVLNKLEEFELEKYNLNKAEIKTAIRIFSAIRKIWKKVVKTDKIQSIEELKVEILEKTIQQSRLTVDDLKRMIKGGKMFRKLESKIHLNGGISFLKLKKNKEKLEKLAAEFAETELAKELDIRKTDTKVYIKKGFGEDLAAWLRLALTRPNHTGVNDHLGEKIRLYAELGKGWESVKKDIENAVLKYLKNNETVSDIEVLEAVYKVHSQRKKRNQEYWKRTLKVYEKLRENRKEGNGWAPSIRPSSNDQKPRTNQGDESVNSSFFDSITDFVKKIFKVTGVVTASSLKVRKGPGTNFNTSAKSLPRGTKVQIIKINKDWYCIGEEQWVYGEFIQLDEPNDLEEKKTKPKDIDSNDDEIAIISNVGFSNSYANRSEDVKKIQQGFNALGFNIKVNGVIRFYYEEKNGRKKLKAKLGASGRETITTIFAFQHYFGLEPDGKITPNGETMKKMNEELMNKTKIIRDLKILSRKSNFPKSTNDKLKGISNLLTDVKNFTVPEKYFGNMSELIDNLEIIANEVGGIRISNGYRSPEHNATKYKGRAEASKHMFGIAADLVPAKVKTKEFHAKILNLISNGKIKAGGVGLYGSYVHYDIRGINARW